MRPVTTNQFEDLNCYETQKDVYLWSSHCVGILVGTRKPSDVVSVS